MAAPTFSKLVLPLLLRLLLLLLLLLLPLLLLRLPVLLLLLLLGRFALVQIDELSLCQPTLVFVVNGHVVPGDADFDGQLGHVALADEELLEQSCLLATVLVGHCLVLLLPLATPPLLLLLLLLLLPLAEPLAQPLLLLLPLLRHRRSAASPHILMSSASTSPLLFSIRCLNLPYSRSRVPRSLPKLSNMMARRFACASSNWK